MSVALAKAVAAAGTAGAFYFSSGIACAYNDTATSSVSPNHDVLGSRYHILIVTVSRKDWLTASVGTYARERRVCTIINIC